MTKNAPADVLDRRVYHFTHVDNLTTILEHGSLRCDNAVQAASGCAEVGDQGLKAKRRLTPVPCGPGGVVADYVPFYFAPRSPMLLRIATRRVEYQGGEGPLLFLMTTIGTIMSHCRGIVFTDGHPVGALTDFFDDTSELGEVDWGVMGQTMWNPTAEDPDRQRRRQAELLVIDELPLAAITTIAARSDEVAADARRRAASVGWTVNVKTQPTWYYGKP